MDGWPSRSDGLPLARTEINKKIYRVGAGNDPSNAMCAQDAVEKNTTPYGRLQTADAAIIVAIKLTSYINLSNYLIPTRLIWGFGVLG